MSSRYKIARLPFPVEQIQKIIDSYDKSKDSPGGLSIKYRMPKKLVATVNEPMGSGVCGAGLDMGECIPWTIMLQPRQLTGLQNAKAKKIGYTLVLTKAQLKQMKGQGLFSTIAKTALTALAPIAVDVVSKKLKGKGTDEEDDLNYQGYEADDESQQHEICPNCNGEGIILKALTKAIQKVIPLPPPKMKMPPKGLSMPPKMVPKNVPRPPVQISM